MKDMLFPAQAGVIPMQIHRDWDMPTVPRASGGDPKAANKFSFSKPCSPRKRG